MSALARVVLDTNVLVSASIKASGSETRVLQLVAESVFDAIVSDSILKEYATVLRRSKFALQRSRSEYLLQVISRYSILVADSPRLSVSPDESDNRFLECAEAAEANFLVTGNKRHFPAQWKSTEILNARELIARLNA